MDVVYPAAMFEVTTATGREDWTGITTLEEVAKIGVSVGQMVMVVVLVLVSVTNPLFTT